MSMKTWMIAGFAAIVLAAAPALAAENVSPPVDEFGSNFTAQAPDALQDDLPDAEGLNDLAPAAGGDDPAVIEAEQESDMLTVPDDIPVPGMEQVDPLPPERLPE